MLGFNGDELFGFVNTVKLQSEIGFFLIMSELVARTGRLQQRYEKGYRLVAGYLNFSWLLHNSFVTNGVCVKKRFYFFAL